jgi:hypothetical protein
MQDEKITERRKRLCYGPSDINELNFQYTADFFDAYVGMRRFAVLHTISCHEVIFVVVSIHWKQFFLFCNNQTTTSRQCN